MTRLVREFVEVADHASLDELIQSLQTLRRSLPTDAEAELRMRGDDIFGRHIAISYLRPQTVEEATCEARYAHAAAMSRPVSLAA